MTIDVHAHFVPPDVLETLADRGREFGIDLVESEPGCHCCRFETGTQIRPFFDTILKVDLRLAEMDRQGIDKAVMTIWTDIFGTDLPAEKAAAWHRVLNDSLTRLCATQEQRFAWMASAPMQDAALAARELERAMGAGAVGVIVSANVDNENLGDRPLDEFWASCVSLSAPVFIHPTQPTAPPRAGKYALNQICAYTYDTTLTVGSMISAGVMDRYPALQLILSHGGGTLPWLIGRFDRMYRAGNRQALGIVAEETPSAYLQRFHYDTILHHGPALRYLRDSVGVGKMLLGTDLPFPPGDPDPLKSLAEAGFTETEIHRIAVENPTALLRL